MTILLEINNPHYENALNEMARVMEISPEKLCSGFITKAVQDFDEGLLRWERGFISCRMPFSARGVDE